MSSEQPSSNLQPDAAFEQPAVRTTIVGGRPPGDIPCGIEVLVKRAAVVMLVALGASALAANGQMVSAGAAPAGPVPTSKPASQPAMQASQPTSKPAIISAAEFEKLLKQMDSDDYKDREAAQEALADKGRDIVPTLKDRLKQGGLSAEVSSRLQSIINQFEPPARPADARPKDEIGRDIFARPPQNVQAAMAAAAALAAANAAAGPLPPMPATAPATQPVPAQPKAETRPAASQSSSQPAYVPSTKPAVIPADELEKPR